MLRGIFAAILVVCMASVTFAVDAHFMHGYGAVNEAMGGAGAGGNDQDLIGSLHRNPATGALFQKKMVQHSMSLFLPQASIKSSVRAAGMSGESDSQKDIIPLGSSGLLLREDCSPWAFHFLMVAEAGLNLDMAESFTNPVFMPQQGAYNNPTGGASGGFGAVKSEYNLLRLPVGFSRIINDKLSVGLSLAPSLARLRVSPALIDAPQDANGDGIPYYGTVNDADIALGIGVQGGVHYQVNDRVSLGFSVSSPTWFQEFEMDAYAEGGRKYRAEFELDRPLTISLGTSIRLGCKTLLMMEAEWVNFANTEGFDKDCFASDNSLAGFGWDNMWVLMIGVQHDLNDRITLRAGYNYCTNPIPDDMTFFNIPAPVHTKHHLSVGMSYSFCENKRIDMAYTHNFEHSQDSNFCDPAGIVQGTKVRTSLETDLVSLGFTWTF